MLIKLSGLHIFSVTDKLTETHHILAFIQHTNVLLTKALKDLRENPANLALQARVVGLLVWGAWQHPWDMESAFPSVDCRRH